MKVEEVEVMEVVEVLFVFYVKIFPKMRQHFSSLLVLAGVSCVVMTGTSDNNSYYQDCPSLLPVQLGWQHLNEGRKKICHSLSPLSSTALPAWREKQISLSLAF